MASVETEDDDELSVDCHGTRNNVQKGRDDASYDPRTAYVDHRGVSQY